jgi:hypothetical protein
VTDLDQQLDALTDEQLLDAINRRAQRKTAAGAGAVEAARNAKRRASSDLLRSELRRRFGKDLPAPGDTTTDSQQQEPTGGRAEAARRFSKGK